MSNDEVRPLNALVLCDNVGSVTGIAARACGVCDRGIGNKLHRLTERDSRLAHYFALLWVWGYIWAI